MPGKNFVYCIGGTGARVAEVAAHLCAMNLTDNTPIEFIIVDKDTNCGGTDQARRVIEMVDRLSQGGLVHSDAVPASFCQGDLKCSNWSFETALNSINNGGANVSLKNTVCAPGNDDDQRLMNAFYSKKDQDKDTEKGFYGKPYIGSLLFEYMLDHTRGTTFDIAKPVEDYFHQNQGTDDYARVFIIGSIFGGTGASIFPNLAAYIRERFAGNNKLLISGCLLLPYFNVPDRNGSEIASRDFAIKSRTALKQYAEDSKLLRDVNHNNNSFDSIYVCGQDPRHYTASENREGGAEQKNHFDIVDLCAALAMTEFFRMSVENINTNRGRVFEYCFDTGAHTFDVTPVTFNQNMNNVEQRPRKNFVGMLSFCAFALSRPIAHMILMPDDPGNNDTVQLLIGNRPAVFNRNYDEDYANNYQQGMVTTCTRVKNYCASFISFAEDIAKIGKDWTDGTGTDHSNEFQLLSPSYVRNISDLLEYISIYEGDRSAGNKHQLQQQIATVFNMHDIIPGAENSHYGPSAQAVNDRLLSEFEDRLNFYRGNHIGAEERMGDYFHSAFAYCEANS